MVLLSHKPIKHLIVIYKFDTGEFFVDSNKHRLTIKKKMLNVVNQALVGPHSMFDLATFPGSARPN